MTIGQVTQLNPLVWAFVGDAVFTLKVRQTLALEGDYLPDALHKKCSSIINANSQSGILEGIAEHLSEQENDIVRRARNVKTHNRAKNATSANYHKATALEALIGYLYLTEQLQRLDEIQNLCLKVIDNEG